MNIRASWKKGFTTGGRRDLCSPASPVGANTVLLFLLFSPSFFLQASKDSQQEEGRICAVRPPQGLLGACADLREETEYSRHPSHPHPYKSHPQPYIFIIFWFKRLFAISHHYNSLKSQEEAIIAVWCCQFQSRRWFKNPHAFPISWLWETKFCSIYDLAFLGD